MVRVTYLVTLEDGQRLTIFKNKLHSGAARWKGRWELTICRPCRRFFPGNLRMNPL